MLVISSQDAGVRLDKTNLRKALRKVAAQVRKEARKLIEGTGSGRTYGRHRASAPGQPPVRDKGSLNRVMKTRYKGTTARIWDEDWISLPLEGGAKGGGRAKGGKSGKSIRWGKSGRTATTGRIMLPRPYLSLALANTPAQQILTDSLRNIVRVVKKGKK